MATGGRRRGSTLAEVLAGVLLMGIAVASMAGVLLQGGEQSSRLELRERGAMQASMVLQMLKGYVTADPSAATQASAPNGCWNFVDPATGVCSGWALTPGAAGNDVTFLLPDDLKSTFGMTMSYDVSSTYPLMATVHVTWPDR